MQYKMDVRAVSGSGPLAQGQEGGNPAASLKPGQVLVGKVLESHGRMARVEVGGRTMDVQTAVPLSKGDELRLKVTAGPGGQIRLQVQALQGKGSLLADPHIGDLLEKMGLPTDKVSLAAARSLLGQSESVQPGQVRDLAKLFATLKTSEERAAASFLIARGLPASPAAIALVAGRPGDPATAGKRVADRLEALKKVAPDLLSALANLDLGDPTDSADLAEALQRLAKGLNPPEAEILAYLRDRQGNLADRLAHNLSALLDRFVQDNPQAQAQAGAKELASELRFQQLADSSSAAHPSPNPAEVRLPLVFAGSTGDLVVQKWQGNAKDPAGHARVLLNLDMPELGHVTIDLMYAKGSVGGRLTVGDEDTRAFLAGRLADLQTGLGKVGIGVNHLEVGTPRETAPHGQPPGRFDLRL